MKIDKHRQGFSGFQVSSIISQLQTICNTAHLRVLRLWRVFLSYLWLMEAPTISVHSAFRHNSQKRSQKNHGLSLRKKIMLNWCTHWQSITLPHPIPVQMYDIAFILKALSSLNQTGCLHCHDFTVWHSEKDAVQHPHTQVCVHWLDNQIITYENSLIKPSSVFAGVYLQDFWVAYTTSAGGYFRWISWKFPQLC